MDIYAELRNHIISVMMLCNSQPYIQLSNMCDDIRLICNLLNGVLNEN